MSFYRRWILACAAGELVGIGVAGGVAFAIGALIGEPQSLGSRLLTLAVFAAVGAVEGTALAGFQWRVLRARLPRLRAGEWVGVTVAVAVAGAGAGLCFGAAQWCILRRHAERAHWWIWVHAPAWALAMSGIFLGASLPEAGSSGWFIGLSGAAGGVLGGLKSRADGTACTRNARAATPHRPHRRVGCQWTPR